MIFKEGHLPFLMLEPLEVLWEPQLLINQKLLFLALGIIKKRPEVITTEKGDEIAIRSMMYLIAFF